MGDVCDAEVACEHYDADGEVPPRTGAGVRECDFEESVSGVHSMLGDVEPCWKHDVEGV